MANESTTTTLNDIVGSEVIDAVGKDYVHDWTVITPLLQPFSLIGQGTSTYQLWRLQSDMGTVGANGDGVDTEFDATEATDLSNTALDTDQIQLTASEYGVMRTLTDNVFEDSISGIDFLNVVVADAARILVTAFEDDCAALLGAFSNTAGSTGVNITLANMTTCIVGIRNRGVRAPDGLCFVLDEQAASDYEDLIVSTNAAAAVYAGSADRFLGLNRDGNNGLTNGMIGEFRGNPVYMTGLTDTANTAADVESACFVPYTPANGPMAALGCVTAREFRVEQDRDASLRGTEFVATMRKGCGELYDAAGQTLITDA
jgi:hypothetical protein